MFCAVNVTSYVGAVVKVEFGCVDLIGRVVSPAGTDISMYIRIIDIRILGVAPELLSRERVPKTGGNQVVIGMIIGAGLCITGSDRNAKYPAVHSLPQFIRLGIVIRIEGVAFIREFPGMNAGRVAPSGL